MRPAVLRHVLLLAADPPATAALLTRALGLPPLRPPTERWAELDAGGGAVLAVTAAGRERGGDKEKEAGPPPPPPRLSPPSPFLCFAVGDVQAAVARLLEGGGELDGPIQYGARGTVRSEGGGG